MIVVRNIGIFDWDGNQVQQMVEDSETFGFEILTKEPNSMMGTLQYVIQGEETALEEFISYYDLEWDDE